MTTPAQVLNHFTQVHGTKHEVEFFSVPGSNPRAHAGWQCVLRVPGVAFEAQVLGTSKKEAQQRATQEFVAMLEASGSLSMMPPSRSSQGKKGSKKKAPTATAMTQDAKRARQPGSMSSGSTGGSGLADYGNELDSPFLVPGLIPGGEQVKPGEPLALGRGGIAISMAPPGVLAQLLDRVQKGTPDAAMEIAEKQLADHPRSLALKQVARLLANIAARTAPDTAVELVEGLVTLDVVQFADKAGKDYFARFSKWAMREFLAEGQYTLNSMGALPGGDSDRAGDKIPLLQAAPGKGGLDVLLTSQRGLLPHVPLQKGDWLFLSFLHSGLEVASFEGELVDFEGIGNARNGICVKLVGTSSDVVRSLAGGTCRVDKAANRVTFVRQMDALRTMCDVPSELAWLRATLLAADEEGDLAAKGAEAALCSMGIRCSFPSMWPAWSLANDSQAEALKASATRRMTLIQGPPGTGKTHTAVLLVRLWTALGRTPVLVSAESNVAVDNLVDGCARAGLNVVRVGRPEVTRLDLEKHNLIEKARSIGMNSGQTRHWMGEKHILTKAEVVCCTCSSVDQPVLSDMTFANVIVDEAAQATELANLMPLLHLRGCGSAVLVGDHCQLPPTVVCIEANREGFSTSLFERLTTRGVQPVLLTMQYRMHPAIGAFPSHQFYGGRLASGVTGAQRKAPKGVPWPVPGAPVLFLASESIESKEGSSYSNVAEAKGVEALITRALKESDMVPNDIGVITPYAAQARLIRRRLGSGAGVNMHTGTFGIEVSSVDGFQGREKELIVVSCVRANSTGSVGFLSDPRRLNVALTRARRGLVVVGHLATLQRDKECWGPWLAWARQCGLIAGLPAEQPLAMAQLALLGDLTPAAPELPPESRKPTAEEGRAAIAAAVAKKMSDRPAPADKAGS